MQLKFVFILRVSKSVLLVQDKLPTIQNYSNSIEKFLTVLFFFFLVGVLLEHSSMILESIVMI